MVRRDVMRFIASNETIDRASRFDLYLFKLLHVLTFKRTVWIPTKICEIERANEQKNNRIVY
ncbi:hypothetical protein [Lentibacillus sp. CBA3610]|uniref:hypothetical protein n=1 Tax=Lentibacillus sp. CBA3610 TaxID=2518176 RepID=UPI0015952D2D|nr:hypothetical protein [Lentibacillus sp. CBA3610]QKY68352.1 hypothetical protein Len3610_00805 [Lentibacillus sp. CBA3610]